MRIKHKHDKHLSCAIVDILFGSSKADPHVLDNLKFANK
jgi:hypothetical protein